MLKTVAVRVFAALVIVAVMGVDQSMAGIPGEVAHSAMGGSTLMRTTAQFNAWTHWIVNEQNFVELSVGDRAYSPEYFEEETKAFGSGRGQGSLHWVYDDSNHLFFRVRQNDLGGQNINFLWGSTLENIFLSPAGLVSAGGVSYYNAYLEGQMVNLAWARPLSGGGAFSVGLFFANAGSKSESEESYSAPGNSGLESEEYENKSSAFGGQVTWGNGNGLDLSLSITSESGVRDDIWNESYTEEGDTFIRNIKQERESDFLNFALAARYEMDSGWIGQLGGIMGSGTRKASYYDFMTDREPDEVISSTDPDEDISVMGLMVNIGRKLLDTDNAGVTAEFFVNYLKLKWESQEIFDYEEDEQVVYDQEWNRSEIVVPGTRVACWTQISKRFQVMAGANAYWNKSTPKWEETLASYPSEWGSVSAMETSESSERGLIFSYSGGLAFVPNDRVRIEGQLNMNQLNNLLSLGNTTPLLLRVGGTFVF